MTHSSLVHRLLAAAALLSPFAATLAQQPRVARLSLPEAVQLAESRSQTVAIARAGLGRATGTHQVVRSQFLPQLSGTGGYTKTLASQFQGLVGATPDTTGPAALCTPRISANATQAERDAALAAATTCSTGGGINFGSVGFGAKNQWVLGVNGSQILFSGGRIAGQNQAAAAQERSAGIELDAQRAQAKLDMTTAYFDAALADRLLAIAESSLVITEAVLKQTQLSRELGEVAEFDLLRAQVARDNQRPVVIQSRGNRDIAYLHLKQLLEFPLGDSLTLSTSLDDTVATSVVTGNPSLPVAGAAPTVTARAPVRELEQGVVAGQGLVRAAKADWIPSLALVSGYQRLYFPENLFPDLSLARQNWTVGLQTNFNIFSGGRISGNVLVAQSNLEETRQRLKQTEELADLDTRVAITQYEQAQAAWVASAGNSEQARRALDIDQIRYREGISTQTDLTQTRLQYEQATAIRATAARNLAVAKMRLQLLNDLPLQLGGSATALPQQQTTPTTSQQSGSTGRPGGPPNAF
jgi:outer membrane protein